MYYSASFSANATDRRNQTNTTVRNLRIGRVLCKKWNVIFYTYFAHYYHECLCWAGKKTQTDKNTYTHNMHTLIHIFISANARNQSNTSIIQFGQVWCGRVAAVSTPRRTALTSYITHRQRSPLNGWIHAECRRSLSMRKRFFTYKCYSVSTVLATLAALAGLAALTLLIPLAWGSCAVAHWLATALIHLYLGATPRASQFMLQMLRSIMFLNCCVCAVIKMYVVAQLLLGFD